MSRHKDDKIKESLRRVEEESTLRVVVIGRRLWLGGTGGGKVWRVAGRLRKEWWGFLGCDPGCHSRRSTSLHRGTRADRRGAAGDGGRRHGPRRGERRPDVPAAKAGCHSHGY